MMVLFISQCEKNALAKTRRVLDAFADRIGDNSWQTIITEEGLQTVKKLLRQTASKSTAVSCHWIRSRSRSDLLWIVGNRRKFNHRGIVPVNYTQKGVFMDIATTEPKSSIFYANTKLQPLAEHSFAVGYLAKKILEDATNNDENVKLAEVAYLAGCLHDIGKIDPLFQEWCKKGKQKNEDDDGQHIDVKFTFENHTRDFTFENHPRHNEISLFLFNLFESQSSGLNNSQKIALQHVVYWHHAKPYRKKGDFTGSGKTYSYLLKNLSKEQLNGLFKNVPEFLKQVKSLSINYGLISDDTKLGWQVDKLSELIDTFTYAFKGKAYPEFKNYDKESGFSRWRLNVSTNAQHNLLRACVISADRIISSLSAEDLTDYIQEQRLDELLIQQEESNANLEEHIANALALFPTSERTKKQQEVANELSEKQKTTVLSGAAGCGKTKIALEWAKLSKAQQIIWICPRVQVCHGIFEELISSYLPDASVELFTGEFKFTNSWDNTTREEDYFSADVVVTTIDQILGSITTHTKVDLLIPFMHAHVVFDEYHEYINMEIFNLLFAELVACKELREKNNKRLLLVSATPHYAYLKNLLGLDADYDVVEMPSFNKSFYKIDFLTYDESDKDSNPFFQKYDAGTFVISNTAKTAQLGFLYRKDDENSVLFHSKFKRSDKKYWFNQVYESFKKDGTKQYDILRSGPIVQASLNITCDAMLTEMSSPENILQRLGRLDRFGENNEVNILTVAITEDVKRGKQVGKSASKSARFLSNLHSLQSAKAWYSFLEEKLVGKEFQLPELYSLYKEFNNYAASEIEQDLEEAIKTSIVLTDQKVSEPVRVIRTATEDKKRRISKNSLRGDSRFVQMAMLDLNDFTSPIYINEYAYSPPLKDGEEFDNLTESLSRIRDSGLVQFMVQKHVNIDTSHPIKKFRTKKISLKHMLLENYARNEDYPLYLSYIEDDLNRVGGVGVRHSESFYYAVCDRQPIGSIQITVLDELIN